MAGSFRDPECYVAIAEDTFLRVATGLTGEVLSDPAVRALLDRLVARGRLIGFEPIASSDATVLRVETIPFISYPYEWSFEMLRDAALVHLDLQIELLDADLILKDASPYNVQFRQCRPLFIDLGSIARYVPGQPWAAYSQFCQLFLNPLLLSSILSVPFQPFLRASLDGIPPATLARLLPMHRRWLPPALTHVTLQAFLNRHSSAVGNATDSRTMTVPKTAMRRQFERLRGTVVGLSRPSGTSNWSTYTNDGVHSTEYVQAKSEVVRSIVTRAHPEFVWDLGSNTGRFAQIAGESASHVVAIDSDESCIDAMYVAHRSTASDILPLVVDVLNPSPAQGWFGTERTAFFARGRRDFFLALALTHHVCVSGHVPLDEWARFLSTIGRRGIVEFVPTDDPMFRKLVQWRSPEGIHPYGQAAFEAAIRTHFRVVTTSVLPGSGRVLYFVESD